MNKKLLKKIYEFCIDSEDNSPLPIEGRIERKQVKIEILEMMLDAAKKGAKFIN